MRGQHLLKSWSSTQRSITLSSGDAELVNPPTIATPDTTPEPLSEKDSMTTVTIDPSQVEKLVLMNGSGPLEICRDPQASTISFTAEVISRAVGLDRARFGSSSPSR